MLPSVHWFLLMCCAMSLLCLSSQSVCAQGKNSSDSSESLKRGRNGAEKRVNRKQAGRTGKRWRFLSRYY